MRENRKKTIRIVVLILILLIGIGYAALKTTLKVDGTVNIDKATWDVHFENVNITEGSVTANPAPTTNNVDTTEMTYTINFTQPGDFFEFTVDIVNKGTIDAMINSLSNKTYNVTGTTETPLPPYLINAVSYNDDNEIEENHLLEHGTSETIKVRIEFKKDISASDLPSDGATTIVFKFDGKFTQADEHATPKDKPGNIVYFDPVSTSNCNSSVFNVDNIKNGTSTCYKWNAISYEDDYVTIMLDHNILWTNPILYTPSSNPDPTLQALANATQTWTRVEPLTYTYDATSLPSSTYGKLTCTNGTCTVTGSDTPKVTGLRARIITAEEIRQLTLDAGASDTSAAYNWSISTGTGSGSTGFYFSSLEYRIGEKDNITNDGTTKLKWLLQNLSQNSDSGATDNLYGSTSQSYYWTLSPYYAMSSYYAWRVTPRGHIMLDGTSNSGIRPVIRIPISLLK